MLFFHSGFMYEERGTKYMHFKIFRIKFAQSFHKIKLLSDLSSFLNSESDLKCS